MEEQKSMWAERIKPTRLADSANRRFVELGGLLMRAITLSYPISLNGTGKAKGDKRGKRDGASSESGEPPFYSALLSLDPGALASLVKKVDGVARNLVRNGLGDSHSSADMNGQSEGETFRQKLKDLFHNDAWRRLAAARWIREHRCAEAKSILEGVLSIEESVEVRSEIERTLNALDARRANGKGD